MCKVIPIVWSPSWLLLLWVSRRRGAQLGRTKRISKVPSSMTYRLNSIYHSQPHTPLSNTSPLHKTKDSCPSLAVSKPHQFIFGV